MSAGRVAACTVALVVVTAAVPVVEAQGRGGRGGPPPTPREDAAFDLTGTWVSVVTEDWRWRMVTPPKNDVASIPLNAAGRAAANGWDLEADNANGDQCRAFGAGGIMRLPTRVRIGWDDDDTLRVETDAGTQTRVFHFRDAPPGERSWQGHSVATWARVRQSAGLGFGGGGGDGASLAVVTTNVRAGYLRKNGVPYSEDAVITEYYNRHSGPGALEWFTVTTVVDDPAYLNQPFITSSSFLREADDSGWNPTACRTAPPTAPSLPAVPGGRG